MVVGCTVLAFTRRSGEGGGAEEGAFEEDAGDDTELYEWHDRQHIARRLGSSGMSGKDWALHG